MPGLFFTVFKMTFKNKKRQLNAVKKRAENEARTRDPNLGKVVLYQLSYFRNFENRKIFCSKTLFLW